MPIHVGVGVSNNRRHKLAILEAVSQARRNLHQRKTSLIIVFASFEFAFPYLLKIIDDLVGPDVPLVGATSNVILTNEGFFHYGIAIALISAEEAYINTGVVKGALTNLRARGDELGKQLLLDIKDAQRHFNLFFSDELITDSPEFLRGIYLRLGSSFPVIGATFASENIHLKKTYQFFNREVLSSSVVGLLWAGKIDFGIGAKHGWKPIGKPYRVNKLDKSIIKEIEKKPAVSLYEDYFAKDASELKKELKRISCLYPLGINIPGEDEYLLRNIISIEDDGSLCCRGEVPQDSQVQLMIGTKESCLLAAKEAAQEARRSFAQEVFLKEGNINIILVFYSASRLYLLGRQVNEELEIINSHFPDIPIIGLCTYTEQVPLKTVNFAGKTYCHNQTITILAIG